jgi:hypothetical protein
MQTVLGNTPIEEFKAPEDKPLPNKPMFNGKYLFENRVKIDKTTGKLATDYTPQKNIIEQIYSEVHNILHYVNKNNLLGPIPAEPWQDPNYTNWELPVEKWAVEQGINTEKPPSSFDDIHRAEDQPEISINNPDSFELSSNNLVISIDAKAPRGISRIEYFFDNNLIESEFFNGEKNIENFSKSLTLPNKFSNGEHLLKTIIYDDLENDSEDTIRINLQIPDNPIRNNLIKFKNLSDGSLLSSENFPYEILIQVSETESVERIDFYWLSKLDNSSTLITSIKDISEEITITIQEAPNKGAYDIYTIVQDQNGRLQLDKKVEIEIK